MKEREEKRMANRLNLDIIAKNLISIDYNVAFLMRGREKDITNKR